MSSSIMEIRVDDLCGPEIAEFLTEHLRCLAEVTPSESRHALNFDELRKPEITFWSVGGCGALKQLDVEHGEIKSMRTGKGHLRQGVASMVLEKIITEAKRQGY